MVFLFYAYISYVSDFKFFLEFMTKEELQNEAQDLADASLKKPAEPGSFYTGWNSMTTLLKKDLVSKHSNPAK